MTPADLLRQRSRLAALLQVTADQCRRTADGQGDGAGHGIAATLESLAAGLLVGRNVGVART